MVEPETGKWEVDETEESEEDQPDVITYEISHYPADYTLTSYLDKWESKQLIIPEFQRNYVWGQVQASKLIESFLLGLPVPAVFLYKQRMTKKLFVIDGQQRIFSTIRFLKNEFDERIFRLKGVNKKWEGKTFAELDEPERYQLEDSVLRAIVVQQLDPKDDSSIFHIFERLNTGGVNLTPMEVRKCVYFGKFFSTMAELNTNDSWRKIIGKKKPDRRLRDIEFILRILALQERWQNYTKPMKGFLNDYMVAKNRLQDSELGLFLSTTKNNFEEACRYVLDQLGEKPFHLRRRLNYAVMDSSMTAAFKAASKRTKNFGERFKCLTKDKEYYENVTVNTSDEKAVQKRFSKAIEYLLK